MYDVSQGQGSSLADRQIITIVSHDNGYNWIEKEITISGASETFEPIIAATFSTIVILYAFEDAQGNRKSCISQSTDYGNSFTNIISTDNDFSDILWGGQVMGNIESLIFQMENPIYI